MKVVPLNDKIVVKRLEAEEKSAGGIKDPAQVPALLVSVRRDATSITKHFTKVELLAERKIPAGLGEPRTVRFYALSGFKTE